MYPFCREVRNIKSKTYEAFVEKFKPKKTTDDCYTPSEIYEVIKDWVCKRYNIDPENVIRPFWPGGDYEKDEYPPGCVVVDNPPFSILKNICEFYLERGIPFFLFAPSLTALSGKTTWDRMNHIVCDCSIVYENGATVRTSFITSFEPETVAETSPELTKLVNDTVEKLKQEKTRKLSKYDYPDHIVTAAMMQKMAHYGVHFRVRREECQLVRSLDAQRSMKKEIYGAGLLLSDQAAARKQNAEKQAAENTNSIRIVLQHVDGTPVKADDFDFEIIDDNTLFNYDNDLLLNGDVTYIPWAKGQAQTGVSIVGPGQVVPQPIEVAYAELCTSRLMTNNSPRLLVKRHEDGGTVIDFPLNNYLLLMRSDRYSKMGDQEYLDRESRWTLYFFLQAGIWLQTRIVVNDWVVRINDIEM